MHYRCVPAASIIAWTASCGVAKVRWLCPGAACSSAAETMRTGNEQGQSARDMFRIIGTHSVMVFPSYGRLPPPPPPLRARAPRSSGSAPDQRLEYPWSLCVRTAPPSLTPPKALRFPLGVLGAICRLPIRSDVPDGDVSAPRLHSGRSRRTGLKILANAASVTARYGLRLHKERPDDVRHRGTRRCFPLRLPPRPALKLFR